jgi:hypothetical protein
LSSVEVWFSIVSRKCLERADFADATVATQRIERFITTYNTHSAHAFTRSDVSKYRRAKFEGGDKAWPRDMSVSSARDALHSLWLGSGSGQLPG